MTRCTHPPPPFHFSASHPYLAPLRPPGAEINDGARWTPTCSSLLVPAHPAFRYTVCGISVVDMLLTAQLWRFILSFGLFASSLVLGLPIRSRGQTHIELISVERRTGGSICGIPLRNNHQLFCRKNKKYTFLANGKLRRERLSPADIAASTVPEGRQCGEPGHLIIRPAFLKLVADMFGLSTSQISKYKRDHS